MSDSPFKMANATTCKPGTEPTHNCGSREGQLGKPDGDVVLDGWRVNPDGSRTCTYCGSLHEEDFQDILTHYVAGDPGYKFEQTQKGYKFYAHRPGVTNASEGGIKFYGWHVDVNPASPTFAARDANYHAACKKNREENMLLFNRPAGSA